MPETPPIEPEDIQPAQPPEAAQTAPDIGTAVLGGLIVNPGETPAG